nr:type VI secretion system baseplate subunit TssF [Campylobacter concisus]
MRLNGLSFLKNFSAKSFNIKFIFSKDMPSGYVPRLEYFSLFVTPAINLFAMSAEPILNNNRRSEYRIFLDRSNIDAYEIVSINKVVAHSSNNEKRILKNYKSFERFEFLNDERAKDYYFVSNKIDIKLNSYKEISFFKSDSKDQTISIDALCCNGDLPCKLKLGEIDRVLSHQGVTTKNLTIPTSVKRVKIDGNLLWKLVSILSFSYQSILEKGSFLALLNTFSASDDEFFKKFANSLYDIKTKQIYRVDQGFAKRGLLCIFYIDESEFESIGNVYALGINLAKFLSKFASINSFCELKIKCIKSKILLNYNFLGGTKKLI